MIGNVNCLALVLVSAVMCACVTPQPLVKDVALSPNAHLNSQFSEARLSEPVRNALGTKAAGAVKRQIQLDIVMTNIEGDSKRAYDSTYTYYILDNGLVRRLIQTGSNGIVSVSEFELGYYGVFDLIYQSMFHSSTSLNAPTFAKSITRLDKGIADPKESSEYVFEYALAPEIQLMNFTSQKTVCKTEKWISATTIHPKMPGMAMTVDCEYFGANGQTFLKRKSAFIKDMGITVPLETATTTRKRTYTVNGVK